MYSPLNSTEVDECRYKTELKRIQEDLREEVERNLRQSKMALQEYEDQVKKLECQKQLLLKQVNVSAYLGWGCLPAVTKR